MIASPPSRDDAWLPAGDRPWRSLPTGAALAGAALLGAAVASRSPPLIGLALAPVAAVAITRPGAPVLVFVAGFYLNLPVLAAHALHVPAGLASMFAALLIGPFVAYVVVARRPLVVTPAIGLMVAYLVVLVLSATLSAGGRRETVGPIVTFLTEGLLLYLLVSNVVRTPDRLRAVIWTLLLAGAFMGAVSLWQEATHAYHDTLGGLAQVDTAGNDLRPRLAGPIGEKNRYAQVLVVLLPLAFARVRVERRHGVRLLAGSCGGLMLCGVVLTFSRGAAVAMALLMLAMAALRALSVRKLLVLVLSCAALVAVIAPDYVARLQTLGSADSALSQTSEADNAIRGRATESMAAFLVFRDHPLLGVGPGEFFRRYSAQYGNALDLRFLDENRRAHTLYLEIAADTGALGLAVFLGIVGTTMAALWRANAFWRRRDPELASLAEAFLLALVAYAATGMFLQLAYQRYFWFLVALANATAWMLRREAASCADADARACGDAGRAAGGRARAR